MTRSGFIATALAVATATSLLGGCGKKSGAPAGGPAGSQPVAASHVSGTPHTDDVVDAWRSAGLRPEGFAPLQPIPYGAAFCEEGRVQGIDTLVCEYADDGTLGRGQQLLKDEWGREGVHTGVTLTTKRTLLAIVDRGRHDPNGKTISQLVKAFRKL
jgi:hypothetical protein